MNKHTIEREITIRRKEAAEKNNFTLEIKSIGTGPFFNEKRLQMLFSYEDPTEEDILKYSIERTGTSRYCFADDTRNTIIELVSIRISTINSNSIFKLLSIFSSVKETEINTYISFKNAIKELSDLYDLQDKVVYDAKWHERELLLKDDRDAGLYLFIDYYGIFDMLKTGALMDPKGDMEVIFGLGKYPKKVDNPDEAHNPCWGTSCAYFYHRDVLKEEDVSCVVRSHPYSNITCQNCRYFFDNEKNSPMLIDAKRYAASYRGLEYYLAKFGCDIAARWVAMKKCQLKASKKASKKSKVTKK